jgi:hypothetical protein
MQWKWRVLKFSAILLGSVALMLFLLGSYGIGSEIRSVSSQDSIIYFSLAAWWALSMVVAILEVRCANTLLARAEITFVNQSRPVLWMLIAGLPVLAGWLFIAGFILVEWMGMDESQKNTIPATTYLLFGGWMLLTLLAIVNYLLGIAAYFELGYRRRHAEEQLITDLGSREDILSK